MTDRVEEIRRRRVPGNSLSANPAEWPCEDVTYLLTALAQANENREEAVRVERVRLSALWQARVAQAEREREGSKAEGYSIGYKEGLERGTNESRAEVERLGNRYAETRQICMEAEADLAQAEREVERLKSSVDTWLRYARVTEERAERAEAALARVREALKMACLIFDKGYGEDSRLVPSPEEQEWREQARAALEGRG